MRILYHPLHFPHIRGDMVVSISACHAEDLGPIPGRGALAAQRMDTSWLGDAAISLISRVASNHTFLMLTFAKKNISDTLVYIQYAHMYT